MRCRFRHFYPQAALRPAMNLPGTAAKPQQLPCARSGPSCAPRPSSWRPRPCPRPGAPAAAGGFAWPLEADASLRVLALGLARPAEPAARKLAGQRRRPSGHPFAGPAQRIRSRALRRPGAATAARLVGAVGSRAIEVDPLFSEPPRQPFRALPPAGGGAIAPPACLVALHDPTALVRAGLLEDLIGLAFHLRVELLIQRRRCVARAAAPHFSFECQCDPSRVRLRARAGAAAASPAPTRP